MEKQGRKKRNKYETAQSILFWLFILAFLINMLVRKFAWWDSALYLTILSAVFAIVSGYVAYQHSKLPKKQREKIDWLSVSIFSIHPYVTFVLFVIFCIIGIVFLFK